LAQDFSDPEDNVNPPLSFTRRYCAPEVASQEACGRSADIFSLGCVFLEILTIHEKGNLQGLVSDRSEYTAYHQQLNKIDTWLSNSLESMLTASVIRAMLCSVPRARPSAKDVLIILAEQDAQRSSDAPSMFMSCCKSPHTLLSRVGPSQPKLNNIPVTTPWSQSSQSRPAPSIFDSDTRNKESYLTSFGTSTGPKNAEHECLDDGHANVVGPTLSVISTENPLLLEYIRIFADRLATEIQNDEQSAATALPGVSDLSKIVKVFAARLHEESTNPFEWETSATILRHSK
jgi:serine/threonine protein kinase